MHGATPLGSALKKILSDYMEKLKKNEEPCKRLNILVITDGAPFPDCKPMFDVLF